VPLCNVRRAYLSIRLGRERGRSHCVQRAVHVALVITTFAAIVQAQAEPGIPAADRAEQASIGNTGSNQAAAARGRRLLGLNCAFCHGSNARGTGVGPDLTGTGTVQRDLGSGIELGQFLKSGNPAKGMPAFPNLTPAEVADLARFLHVQLLLAQSAAPTLSILVGDAGAGERYFHGHCDGCHAADKDLHGIGTRYNEKTLQARIVNPRAGGGGGAAAPKDVPIEATVHLRAGPSVSGQLLGLSDFFVTIRESGGARRTFARDGRFPVVTLNDPLHAHFDFMRTCSDADLHNLTAYLVTLK
jgi:cytochrome c oxidase cbb3-type subunit 3